MHKLSDTQSILMYHFVVKVLKNLGLEIFKIKLQSLICNNCVLGKYKLYPCSTSLLLASNNTVADLGGARGAIAPPPCNLKEH